MTFEDAVKVIESVTHPEMMDATAGEFFEAAKALLEARRFKRTLRDEFAMAYVAGGRGREFTFDESVARAAYEFADFMLAEREKTK